MFVTVRVHRSHTSLVFSYVFSIIFILTSSLSSSYNVLFPSSTACSRARNSDLLPVIFNPKLARRALNSFVLSFSRFSFPFWSRSAFCPLLRSSWFVNSSPHFDPFEVDWPALHAWFSLGSTDLATDIGKFKCAIFILTTEGQRTLFWH